MLPKVLVATTIYDGKDYILDKFVKNVLSFSYPNYEFLLVDNSRSKKYTKMLKKKYKDLPIRIEHTERGETSREAQARGLNRIREVMLEEGFDYWMSIESDLIPPRDIIERMISHGKDVVGSMYNIGYAYSKTQPPRYCLFRTRENPHGKGIGTENIPPSVSKEYFGNGVVRIHGCGIGCTLISRRIMERFKFWYSLGEPVKHSDVLFYMDLHNNNEFAWVDTDMVIPHFNSDWNLVKDI